MAPPWICPLCCSEEFTNKSHLVNHLIIKNSTLKCPICKQEQTELFSLILHLQNQCSDDSQISSRPSLSSAEPSASYPQSSELSLSTKHINLSPDVFVNSNQTLASSSRDRGILLRRRKKLIPVSRKTASKNNGKNTGLSNRYADTSFEISQVESLGIENTTQRTILQFNNGNDWTISGTDSEHPVDSASDLTGLVDQPTPSSTGEQTAESEIDVDNVSMISDESSLTTNDYSSSQNEILSDDDCSENLVGYARLPVHASNSSRQVGAYRNNSFINNLQVINNNFYTILLNNGSYEGTSGTSPTIPNENNGNYQRRNTKNNNSQMNNNCNTPAVDHGSVLPNVSMRNNLHGNRAAKNSNLNPANTSNCSGVSIPGPSHFTVANDSPNKYAVKNTNITKNISVNNKEVSTTNLESRNSLRQSVPDENTNSNEETDQDAARVNDEAGGTVNHPITRLENSTSQTNDNVSSEVSQDTMENPTSSEANHHQVISRSTSSRMQKIQNVDCIQNSTSSQTLNPSTSALCKTNSFPLCNYIRSQQGAANKCKLIKYNANEKRNNTNETETLLNNTQGQNTVPGNAMNVVMVTNNIAEASTNNTVSNESDENTNVSTDTTMSPSEDNATSQTQSIRNPNIDSNDPTENVEHPFQSELSGSHAESTNVYEPSSSSQVNNKNVCNSTDIKQIDNKISTSLGLGINKNQSLESTHSNETNSDQSIRRSSPSTSFDENEATALQSTASMPNALNNTNSLNNNPSNSIPTTTANIVSFNNNLHKNKKSNLNQLGRRNVNKEEKLFTIEKEPSGQQNVTAASEASSSNSYQVINNSIERNFNKLNTCSQEINAHKHVKPSQNRKSKKSKRPVSEQLSGRVNNTGVEYSANNPIPGSSSQSVTSNSNTIETIETNPSTSANVFQDMNNSTPTNHRPMFNNNHSISDTTDKNMSKTFNKKDLLNMKRNNFDFATQEHSNVRRSNSLNVRINDLATTGSNSATQPDDKQRKSITKSNSFTIRNNIISEPGPSQERCLSEKKQNCNNSSVGVNSQTKLTDMKNNISKRLENVDLNSDAAPTNEIESREVFFATYSRDALERFRLEEATNIAAILNENEENDPFLNETIEATQPDDPDQSPVFSNSVLNNCVEYPENTTSNKSKPSSSSFAGSSSSSSNAIVNPRMIHNNIEPRCKKNKKCNEEREPLKPINSETKNKPSEQ